MFPPSSPVGFVKVVEDYGPIGRGASKAHYVLAENGSNYIVKGPTLTPEHPYVAANEIITASLAEQLGLPVLDSRIALLGDTFVFASAYMSEGTFYPDTTESLFNMCSNRDRAALIVVFDVWTHNTDRHHQNLLVRKRTGRDGQQTTHTVLLNDHSHALVPPGRRAGQLGDLLSTPADTCVRLPFLKAFCLANPSAVRQAVAQVRAIDSDRIHSIVDEVPDTWLLVEADRGAIVEFLRRGQTRLGEVFRDWGADFQDIG